MVTVVGTKRTVISSDSGSRHLIGQLVGFEAFDWWGSRHLVGQLVGFEASDRSIGGVRGI